MCLIIKILLNIGVTLYIINKIKVNIVFPFEYNVINFLAYENN